MDIERIFTFKGGETSPNSYDPGDPQAYEYLVNALISDSRDYENSVLAPKRDEAQKYYYGMLPTLNPDGTPYSDTLIVDDPNATFGDILDPVKLVGLADNDNAIDHARPDKAIQPIRVPAGQNAAQHQVIAPIG